MNSTSTDNYDIIVFGGGSAGTVAAIQCARAGLKTALVEKNGVLGGTTVVASVNFPGLFHAWGEQIIRGIGWELIEATVELGGAKLPDFSQIPSSHWQHQILVNRFIYSTVLDRLCLEAGVHLRLHEMAAAVERREDGLHVAIVGKTGLQWLRARKLIDATGDANIAGLMGFPLKQGEVLQPGTLINDIDGYDLSAIDPQQFAGERAMYAAGQYRDLRTHRIHMHVQSVDGADSEGRTAAEIKARQQLLDRLLELRKLPGCDQVQVRYFANECGIRETRRIEGEVEVDEPSYVSGYRWPDAVCYSFYPIDLHHHSNFGIDQLHLAPGIVPTIPYRALIPKGSDDLLVAGRCAAGDRRANSAFRVQASCMAMGQAAGMAAAIAAEQDISVRDVPLPLLRERLEQHGAIVP